MLLDRLLVEVAVERRRVGHDLLRDRDPDLLLGVVDVCELSGQRMLRLAERSLLDDQEVAGLSDDLADLVIVDGDDVIAFHVSPLLGCTALTLPAPELSDGPSRRCRRRRSGLGGSP